MSRTPNHARMLGQLADLLAGLRLDWSSAETRTVLDEAYRDRHSIAIIAAAALDAAMTGTATPSTITARLTEGWGSTPRGWTKQAIDQQRAPLPHGQAYPRCGRCRLELVAGETRENHVCADLVERGNRDELVAEAKRVAAEAKARATA